MGLSFGLKNSSILIINWYSFFKKGELIMANTISDAEERINEAEKDLSEAHKDAGRAYEDESKDGESGGFFG